MTIGKLERDGLIAGDYPLKAQEIVVHGPQTGETEFRRGDVIALRTGNIPALVDSTQSANGGNRAVGIMCDNVVVQAGQQVVTTMYVKGEFAKRHLRFGGDDTVANHERHMTEIGLLVRETRI